MPEFLPDSNNLKRENTVTEGIYANVQTCINNALPLDTRRAAWKKALQLVTKKQQVTIPLGQRLRPTDFNEPVMDKSFIDDRILEGFSPRLKTMVDRQEVNPQAAFAIVEYFLRPRYHGLSDEQAAEFARIFPPKPPNVPLTTYMSRIEAKTQKFTVSGKNAEESWTMKREIFDLIEIVDHIQRSYLSFAYGKTIYISDLMKISAEALHTIHMAGTRYGVKKVMQNDAKLLSGNELTLYRIPGDETNSQIIRNPDVFLAMLLSRSPRDFTKDAERVFKLPKDIVIEGAEHIPVTGPAIIAFSHAEWWKDPSIALNWEKLKMIETIKQRRHSKDIYLVAYLSYFKNSVPKILRGVYGKLINSVVKGIESSYSVHLIDIDQSDTEIMKRFIKQAGDVLKQGHLLLISPEGLPAPEPLKPLRGVGALARTSQKPVVGVAFREDKLPNGSFLHKVIFTPPVFYNTNALPGISLKEKDQAFADSVMRNIAQCLPQSQRGIYR